MAIELEKIFKNGANHGIRSIKSLSDSELFLVKKGITFLTS